jgi:ABC-type xylose transport system permease subunit
MNELDLLNLSRSISQEDISLFTQVITINFAMVVGLYYFLHRARTAMKVFAFAVYLVGMLLFLGMMLLETNISYEAQRELKALPHPSQMTQYYLALNDSWLAHDTIVLFNVAFWILIIGVGYLTFFWDKDAEHPAGD